MRTPRDILDHLLEGRDLDEMEAAHLLELLTAVDLAPAMAGALLAAVRSKGVTPGTHRSISPAPGGVAGSHPRLPTLQ